MGEKEILKDDSFTLGVVRKLNSAIKKLNILQVEESKQILIELQKEFVSEDMEDFDYFQDEIFAKVDFSRDEHRQDFVIDELIVSNIYELSETLRGFRILAKAYNVHCKPKKIIIRSTN